MNYKHTTVKVCTACNVQKIKMSARQYKSKFLDCSICKKAVIYNSSILCLGCDHWCHKKCTELDTSDINTLEKSDIGWYCSICMPNIFPFHQLNGKQIRKELNPLVSSVFPASVTHKAGPVRGGKISRKSMLNKECFSCNNLTSRSVYKNKFIIYNNQKVKLCIPCGKDQSKIKHKNKIEYLDCTIYVRRKSSMNQFLFYLPILGPCRLCRPKKKGFNKNGGL